MSVRALIDPNYAMFGANPFQKKAPEAVEWPERDPRRNEWDPIFGEKPVLPMFQNMHVDSSDPTGRVLNIKV